MPQRDNQALPHISLSPGSCPRRPTRNILHDLEEHQQQDLEQRFGPYLPIPPRPQHLGTGQHHIPDNAYSDVPPTEAWRQQEHNIHQDQREEWQSAPAPGQQPSSQMEVDLPEFAWSFWQILAHATDGFLQIYKKAMKRDDAKQ